jgi:hypothetical protein
VTIGEETKAWYEQHESEQGFCAVLIRSFLFGIVIRRPDFVLLAEEVLTDGKRIVAIGSECPKNCWWIHYLGAPKGATTPYDWMAEAPYPLPYFAFKRRQKIKIYSWERGRKDIGKESLYGRSSPSSSTYTT